MRFRGGFLLVAMNIICSSCLSSGTSQRSHCPSGSAWPHPSPSLIGLGSGCRPGPGRGLPTQTRERGGPGGDQVCRGPRKAPEAYVQASLGLDRYSVRYVLLPLKWPPVSSGASPTGTMLDSTIRGKMLTSPLPSRAQLSSAQGSEASGPEAHGALEPQCPAST